MLIKKKLDGLKLFKASTSFWARLLSIPIENTYAVENMLKDLQNWIGGANIVRGGTTVEFITNGKTRKGNEMVRDFGYMNVPLLSCLLHTIAAELPLSANAFSNGKPQKSADLQL